MSVKVYPYLTDPNQFHAAQKVSSRSTPSEPDTVSSKGTNFADVLKEASRSEQAMAVDALIAQRQGSVDVETVRKVLGFDPAPGAILANSKMEIKVPTMENHNPNRSTDSTSQNTKLPEEATTEELEKAFADASQKYSVDVALLKAIAKAESNFHSNATSGAGAMGIMQLMPQTAKSLGIENAYDAYNNIMGGAQVIAQHLDRYDGNLALALAAYNAGPGNVEKYGGIPPFEETQNYVKKVMSYYLD